MPPFNVIPFCSRSASSRDCEAFTVSIGGVVFIKGFDLSLQIYSNILSIERNWDKKHQLLTFLDDGVLLAWRCMASAVTMFGQSRDDVWLELWRCLATALTMHGDGCDEASSPPRRSIATEVAHLCYSRSTSVLLKRHPSAGALELKQNLCVIRCCGLKEFKIN